MAEYSRKYRLTTDEKKDLQNDMRALLIPRGCHNQIIATAQRHLQLALDRRQPLWRKAWQWIRGVA